MNASSSVFSLSGSTSSKRPSISVNLATTSLIGHDPCPLTRVSRTEGIGFVPINSSCGNSQLSPSMRTDLELEISLLLTTSNHSLGRRGRAYVANASSTLDFPQLLRPTRILMRPSWFSSIFLTPLNCWTENESSGSIWDQSHLKNKLEKGGSRANSVPFHSSLSLRFWEPLGSMYSKWLCSSYLFKMNSSSAVQVLKIISSFSDCQFLLDRSASVREPPSHVGQKSLTLAGRVI